MNTFQFQRMFFFYFINRSLLGLLIWCCWTQIVNNLLLQQLNQSISLIQLLRLAWHDLWKLLLVCFDKLLHLYLVLLTKSPQCLLMFLVAELNLTLDGRGLSWNWMIVLMLRVHQQLLLEMIDHISGLFKLIIGLCPELVDQEHFSFHGGFEVVF